jgi:hypothetical protein
MTTLEEKRIHRFQFLKSLYDSSGGDRFQVVNMWDLGEEFGWDRDTTNVTVQYLVGEGLIEYLTMGGGVTITHQGIRQVEDAIANPERETRYFPPVINLISVGSMVDSQIQQASPGAEQTQTKEEIDFDVVRDFIDELKMKMDQLELTPSSREDLEGEIATIEAQMSVSRPKIPFIKECLQSIRSILEKVAGGLIVAGLLETLSQAS